MKDPRQTARIAGCCFLSALALNLILRWMMDSPITLSAILFSLFLLGTAILLTLAQNRTLLTVFAGINLARVLYAARSFWPVYALYPMESKGFTLCNILSAALFFLLMLLSALPWAAARRIVRGTWFLPGAVLIIRYAFAWAVNDYASMSPAWSIISILSQLVHVAAFLLTGLWLRQAMGQAAEHA